MVCYSSLPPLDVTSRDTSAPLIIFYYKYPNCLVYTIIMSRLLIMFQNYRTSSMEELLAILAKQSNVAVASHAAGSPQVTPRHKSPSKYISRGRSALSLANEWLKPKSGFIHREIPTEIPNKGSKGSLSQFFSLRGSREKKAKSSDPMMFRTRSCSPQKKEIIGKTYSFRIR